MCVLVPYLLSCLTGANEGSRHVIPRQQANDLVGSGQSESIERELRGDFAVVECVGLR